MTSTSACGPRPKSRLPRDLARRQDQGVAAQVPAHSRQGLLHRLGAVGFRSHQRLSYLTDFRRMASVVAEGGHGLGLFLDNAAEDLERRIARDLALAQDDQPGQVGAGQVLEDGTAPGVVMITGG